ncbi:MAG: DUF4058 family protein [Isosphaeraceae bacterium]
MPSPFPGMDPYLEEPRLWPDVHHELISGVRSQLNSVLRPKYHVRIEQPGYSCFKFRGLVDLGVIIRFSHARHQPAVPN